MRLPNLDYIILNDIVSDTQKEFMKIIHGFKERKTEEDDIYLTINNLFLKKINALKWIFFERSLV